MRWQDIRDSANSFLLAREPLDHVVLQLSTAVGDWEELVVPLGVHDPASAGWNRHGVRKEEELFVRSWQIGLVDLVKV
jgi:hypothetical protein